MRRLAYLVFTAGLAAAAFPATVQFTIEGSNEAGAEDPVLLTLSAAFTLPSSPNPLSIAVPTGFVVGSVSGTLTVNGVTTPFTDWQAAFGTGNVVSGGEAFGFNFSLGPDALAGGQGILAQTDVLFTGDTSSPTFVSGTFESPLAFGISQGDIQNPDYFGPATFSLTLLDDGNGNGGEIPEPGTLAMLVSAAAVAAAFRLPRA